MPSLPLLLLLWGVGPHAFPAPVQTRDQDAERVLEYLQKYYNLKIGTNKTERQRNSGLVVEKLKEMQKFFGLKVTGRPDADTLNVMKKARCGVPDVGQYVLTEGKPRWDRTDLTYRIENYTPDLPRAEVDDAIDKAFQLWSNATVLTFTKIFEGEADIMLSFVWGDHGDNSNFGGPLSPIAHAFPPGRGLGGDVHFDEEQTWTSDFRRYNLYYVAAHEVGHSLGLPHVNDPGSLMFSSYNYYGDVLLSQKDLSAIQAIYGPSKNPIQPKEPPMPRPCDSKLTFDAATKIRGESFFFKNGFFLRTGVVYKTGDFNLISDLWESVPNKIDAAYEIASRDEVLFFKGDKYWTFMGYQMLYGYPRDIYSYLGFPKGVKKIDAAVHEDETGKTYFFVANKYWRYDENTQSMDAGFPKEINQDFPGVGKQVDAVFQDGGFFYFFHGRRQYKFDPKTKRILTLLKTNSWITCGSK